MKLFIISLTCLLFIRCSNNEQTTKHQTKATKNRELIYEIHADDLWANFVNIKEPKGRKVVFPDGGKQLSVVIRKDINKDRKADLLVQIGGSETRGALYGLFLKVAEHQFKLAFYDYLKNPAFVKNKDGEFVLQSSEDLEAGDSYRVRFMEYRLENKSATFKLDTTYIFEEHFSHFSRNTVIDSLYFQLTCKDHDPENMFGKSEVKITNLRTGKLIQVIRSEEFWFNQELSVDYKDVNFDGYKDLLFSTGYGGSYGSPTNNYYLFDTTRNRFVYHAGLTEQEQRSCWLLEFNAQKKQVISHEKSGCCWHRTSTFEFKDGKLKLVKRYTDDMATKKTEYF
jgi:hypothetical protein